jgi:nitrate reductase gamma subunit
MQTHALGKLCQLGQASLCGLQQREAIAHENRASTVMDDMRILALIVALCIFVIGLTMFLVKYILRLFDDLWADDDNGYF